MLALLAISCAVVDPVARHSELVDELVERGRELLKHAPPSTLRRTGVAISKIADTFPDSTFAAVANAAMERISSAPTLAELHKYAMNGQLASVVRANARSLMWVPWRRKLQDTVFDLSSLLSSLQTGSVSSEINCASTTPPATLTNAINDLVKAFPIDDFTADSTDVQTFVTEAWGCFCGLSLSGTAGDNIQVLFDTLTTALADASSWPAAATMYTRITEGISAIFATELMCSGSCQKTVAAVIKFVTALGADAFEASLTETTSSATIPLELYQTEVRQMAESMPSCMCSIKFSDIFAGAKETGESFVGMVETLFQEVSTMPTTAQVIASLKLFLKKLLGTDTGFMSTSGLCTGDCRNMIAWMVKFDLTMLTSIPYQALADAVSSSPLRRLARIGGRALGQVEAVARNYRLPARAGAHAAHALAKSGTQSYRLLRAGRRLAPTEYKDAVYNIGDASANCVCDYFDVDKALDVMDVLDDDFFEDEEGSGVVKVLELGRELLVFTFSQYGICAGASDGCLYMQTETARLIGLLERNALEGGLLKSMTLLADTPADDKGVTSLITTIPPCYCSYAFDFGNIFDVYIAWQRNTSVAATKPHTDDTTSVVAGFMSASKGCLSDECKAMMKSVFDFFAGITVANTDDATCTPKNALACMKDTQATSCPNPPTQRAWIGDIANEMGDDISATRALPTESTSEAGSGEEAESMWHDLYWSACNIKYTCPAVGISAYKIKTSFAVANAAEVDSPAKIAALIKKFVKWINDKAGAVILTESMVTAVVTNSRRRGRSLAAATVTLNIETTSELAKLQVIEVTDSESSTTAELSTSLGVTVSGVFTTSEVDTVTYPPPPPAPGYKDNVGKQSDGDGKDTNIALIVGSVVGGCAFILAVAAIALVIKKKNIRPPKA